MKRTFITLSCLALVSSASACSGPSAGEPSVKKADARDSASPAGVSEDVDTVSDDGVALAEPAAVTPPFVRVTTPLFPESPDLVQFTKTTWALATPFADGERLGLVSGNRPIGIQSHVENDDCETPWVEVVPRGFVCMEAKPASERARERAANKKKRKRALIGSYAIAGKGARFFKSIKAAEAGTGGRPARGDMLRLGKSVTTTDGRVFKKTDRGEYIAASDIRRLWGSKYAGVELPATLSGPIAFAVNRRSVKGKVVVRSGPSEKAGKRKALKARALVSVLEISEDESFARVDDGQWVARADLREIDLIDPPAEVGQSENMRWADIDLDKQVVVVYDGRTPIFATLASTGREGDRTPTGVFRVTRKKRRTTMRSDRARRQTYSAAVPWSTYFHQGIAFHTAYWHDTFGKARSHGCVNLSPSDAKTVYEMLGPEVPSGWSVVYGHESQIGSVVQVRSVRPNPVPELSPDEADDDDAEDEEGDSDAITAAKSKRSSSRN